MASTASETPSRQKIKIGTRKSKLALIQTEMVRAALAGHYPDAEFEIIGITTMGDNNQSLPLHSFGAKSLWTLELETLLLDHSVDMIVHSLKDMPTQLPAGCVIGSVSKREDPRDALVMQAGSKYSSLEELPAGSVVGTSSVRRAAQIARKYPHLKFQDVRGNVGTRLSKLDDPNSAYSCLILATAGLLRLDLESRISSRLSHPILLHAVGQGALGIEIRENDKNIINLIAPLTHKPTLLSCFAERQLMRSLEGGCSVPIGVETELVGSTLTMRASVSSVDGTRHVAAEETTEGITDVQTTEDFGRKVAAKLLDGGAGDILKDIVRAKETSAQAAEVSRKEEKLVNAIEAVHAQQQ